MRIESDTGTLYLKRQDSDTYLNGFISNLFLRPSCYNCDHKYLPRISDITVADFWDITTVTGIVDDNKGVSLALLNSEKGKFLFEQVREQLQCSQVDVKKALENNYAITNSVKEHKKRSIFFLKIQEKDIDKLINQCLKMTLGELFQNQIARIKWLFNRVMKW